MYLSYHLHNLLTSIYLNVLNKTTKGLYANTGPLLYNINNDIS